MSRSSGSRLVRSSRAETRSCPTPPEPKFLLSRWQCACPKAPLSAGLVLDSGEPVSRLFPSRRPEGRWSGPVSDNPEGKSVPDGRCSKPAATASAEGQARPRPHRGGFVSRPAVRSAGHRSEDGARASPGLWLGRLTSVAGGSSRPRLEAVMLSESHQAQFRLWITRITCISPGRPNRREIRFARRHARLAPRRPPA